MTKSLLIARKEIRDFFRDTGDLAFALLLPILIFALMYGVFSASSQFNGTAYIVNEDGSGKYAAVLIDDLINTKGITVKLLTAEDADAKLDRSAIYLAVIIPSGFSDTLAAGQPTQLTLRQRGNGSTEGQIIASIVRGIADNTSRNVQVMKNVTADLADRDIPIPQIELVVQDYLNQEKVSPLVAITETTVGSSPDPVNQYLPGIMTMFVLFGVSLTAQSLVDERRKGTLERLIASRLKMSELFFGKFLAYVARGFIQTLILLALSYAVFQMFTPLTFLEAMLIALIFATTCATIGILIGSICRTANQATWIAVFVTMAIVMLSGTFFPISEGSTLYTVSRFSINTYANDAFRMIMAQGGSLADIKMEILVLLSVTVIGLIISRFIFRAVRGGK
ncbi:MAG: ABC transporter permease [Dehalococcoidales bacterium]|nr:ABC transporter permease [Dehalococcoidales bacterium]